MAGGRTTKDVLHWNSSGRRDRAPRPYAEFGNEKYLNLWEKLDADPSDFFFHRNMAISQPLLWIVRPDAMPIIETS